MRGELAKWNFDEKPLLVFWETTKACLLACRHCRAEAIRNGLPGELTTEEAMALIDQVLKFDEPRPALIFTGGDLLMRKDIFELIESAVRKGLRVAAAPSVTPLLTPDVIFSFRRIGVQAISVSLDGACAETHDTMRGVPGNFDSTVKILEHATKLGLRVQANTTVMKSNHTELADIFHLLRLLRVPAWEVFFLIRTGRGAELQDLEPQHYEDVMHFLYDASHYGITIRTTEGPHFRRVVSQRLKDVDKPQTGTLYEMLASRLRELEGPADSDLKAQTTGTRDGKGIIFVAYDGQIFPSGFLPMSLGNIRNNELKEVYSNNPILRAIRRSSNLKGRCGFCEYRELCGGSRSRAYAFYQDPFQEDPACIFQPMIA
ncbi:MAG: TIGR04053 family radical SAM/SPASM domain-containing protein [Thaumarchaeota archaeon]|nr:TIGR04053 family radical SAM/SPASM domain-containing protein [Nitrososphaerota archaeon]